MRILLCALFAMMTAPPDIPHSAASTPDALIQKVTDAYSSTRTLVEDVSESYTEGKERYTHHLELEKPDKVFIKRYMVSGKPERIVVSNSKTVWIYSPSAKEYEVSSSSAFHGKVELNQLAFENLFLQKDLNVLTAQMKGIQLLPAAGSAKVLAPEIVNGVLCDVLEFSIGTPGSEVINRFYFGPDYLLRRMAQENWAKGKLSNKTNMIVTHLLVDKPIPPSRFQFKPGPNIKKVEKFS